jgi:hypothetical protein
MATGAGLSLMAGTTPRTFTVPAGIAPGQLHLFGYAMHGLHEGDGGIITQIIPRDRATASGLRRPSSSEEVPKQVAKTGKGILEVARPLIAAALQTFMAIGIVDLPFLDITEYFVGLGTFFKLGLGLFIIRVSVRMMLHSKCPIGLLYLSATGVPAYR